MKYFSVVTVFLCIAFSSCVSLKPTTIITNRDIKEFIYFYIAPSSSLVSGSGYSVDGQYYSTSKTVNPADLIAGVLVKNGFVRLPEQKSEYVNQTLMVNYGESGRRSLKLIGYTLEVTIQILSADSNELVCSCTAEGLGETEADDIRKAINKCLTDLLN